MSIVYAIAHAFFGYSTLIVNEFKHCISQQRKPHFLQIRENNKLFKMQDDCFLIFYLSKQSQCLQDNKSSNYLFGVRRKF